MPCILNDFIGDGTTLNSKYSQGYVKHLIFFLDQHSGDVVYSHCTLHSNTKRIVTGERKEAERQ